MITLITAAAIMVASVAFVLLQIRHAVVGREDEWGFHFGTVEPSTTQRAQLGETVSNSERLRLALANQSALPPENSPLVKP
jgi:hypothetical protein